MSKALGAELGGLWSNSTRLAGGMFFWLRLPDGVSSKQVMN